MNSFHHLQLTTRGKGLYPFTRDAAKWVASTGVQSGLLTIFVQHTSASLVMQENADPDVVSRCRRPASWATEYRVLVTAGHPDQETLIPFVPETSQTGEFTLTIFRSRPQWRY